MRVATNESWRDRQTGDRREKAEYHSVVIFNENLAKIAEQYLKKGAKVYLEGALQTRKWQDQNGNDRYSTEVALRPFRSELQMLDSKRDGDTGQSGYGGQSGGYGGAASGGRNDFDDDIPFGPEWRL